MNAGVKISRWIKEHHLALYFALLAGLLSVLPHLLAVHALGGEYKGIPYFMIDNEDYYFARVQEIRDGHGFVASPYFYEYKNSLPVVPSIGEYLYILLATVSRLGIPDTLVLAKFLFPAVLFLLIYTLIRKVSEQEGAEKNTLGALAGACIVVMAIDILNYQHLFERLLGTASDSVVLSQWVRPVNPITGALFLFTYLHLLWRSVNSPSWRNSIACGVMIALSLGYVFSVGIELTILGVLIIVALYWKDFALLKRLFVIAGVGIGIASLYWLRVFGSLASGEVSAEKNGLMFTRDLLLNKVLLVTVLLALILLLFLYYKKGSVLLRDKKSSRVLWFCATLLLSGLIVLNQQIVTGMTIWPYHFVQYTNPIAVITLFILGFVIIRPYAKWFWVFITTLSILISISFAVWNSTTYVYAMDEFRTRQTYAPLFGWLRENALKDSVVLSLDDDNEVLTGLIPGFTSCNVYQTKNYVSGSTPDSRVHHSFFILLRMRGIDANEIDEYLAEHSDLVLRYYYKDWFELFGLIKNTHIADITPTLAEEYRKFLQVNLEVELSRYRLDYILTTVPLSISVKNSLSRHITPVFTSLSSTIYKFQ